jgi:stearoyl-CoA desaturase (delta-9 desaturase)
MAQNKNLANINTNEQTVWGNVVFLLLTPLLAVILVPWFAMTHTVTASHIIAMFAMWWAAGLGITVGYHRLYSHRTYKAKAWFRFVFAILGASAWQNSIITWCAGHRYHHRDVDTAGDPYNAKRGFLWSHIVWVMKTGPRHDALDNVPDLWKDPICVWQHKHYYLISSVYNLGVPFLLGLATGDVLGMMIFAGLARVVLVHQFTFCINSVAHMFGTQPWSDANTSRDNWFISFFTFGEGYHNYHHAFQADYRNGTFWYNFDPGKWLIWSFSKVGATHSLRKARPDVVMRRRFEESRSKLAIRLDALGAAASEKVAQWEKDWNEKSQIVSTTMHAKLEEAETRLETSLVELRESQRQWADAQRKRFEASSEELRSAATREVKELKRLFREKKKAAKASMAEWETSLRECYEGLEAVPA